MTDPRLPHRFLRRLWASLLLPASILVTTGCESGSGQLDKAIGSYNAGRYQQAFDEARTARQSAKGELRYESAYLAGLSAIRIERPITARTYLEEASKSRDSLVAGRADVCLGTLLLDDGEPLAAARAFDRAADRLEGTDAARARRRSGLAFRAAGDETAAESRLAGNPALEPLTPGRFTIQGGFFKDRLRAVRRAEALSTSGRTWSTGPAKVILTEVRGSNGWVVQIGDFPNRTDAELTRRRLGDEKTFVTRIASP